jgi:hypothetical protein
MSKINILVEGFLKQLFIPKLQKEKRIKNYLVKHIDVDLNMEVFHVQYSGQPFLIVYISTQGEYEVSVKISKKKYFDDNFIHIYEEVLEDLLNKVVFPGNRDEINGIVEYLPDNKFNALFKFQIMNMTAKIKDGELIQK